MADFTLSGLPVGNTEQFNLDALAQLPGSFEVEAVITNALLQAEASANMSGQLSYAIATVQLLTSTTTFLGGLDFATVVDGQRDALGLVGGGFIDDLSGVQSGPMGFIPLVAFANLTGSLTIQASVSNDVANPGLLSAATDFQDHGLNHETFIGAADASGELLSAAASANMTGEPDPLKDGGSPPFVAFNGTDQYLSIADTADADLRGGANFSCVVVFDPEYVNNAATGVLVGKHDPSDGPAKHGWKVQWDNTTGEITVTVNSTATGADSSTRTTNVGGTGIRVRTVFAFTFDSTTLNLYVAGALSQGVQTDIGTAPGAMVAGDGQFAIGAEDTLTTPATLYRGSVNAVHIFDDVLSGGEVATIDQSGYIPPTLIDANLVASWRPDRIEGSVSDIFLTKWRDEEGARHLVANGLPTCLTYIFNHLRWFSDSWTMNFVNDNSTGLGLGQNLSSNYPLSTSTTSIVESGGFRLFQPPTFQTEPEISSGFRDNLNDITVFFGFRIDESGGSLVTALLELLGLRIVYTSTTQELSVFQGDVGTPTEYDFGIGNDFMEAVVPDGPPTVMALRYNSQLDQFTLFINAVKKFEISTASSGTASTTTGLRFCGEEGSGGADWAALNPGSAQADKRASRVVAACLPDLLIQQILSGFAPDVKSINPVFHSPSSHRAFLRRSPAPELIFGQIVDVDYDVVREADNDPPSPPPSFEPFPDGSGTLEMLGLPNDGEQVTIDDGQGNVETFEFDDGSSVEPGNILVPITGGNLTQTLLNFNSALSATSLRLTGGTPVVFAPDGTNFYGYVRIQQDDIADGSLPLAIIVGGGFVPSTQLRATGPYRVRGPVGTLELLGQPSDGDQFVVNDRINPAITFEFESGGGVSPGATAVTIAGTVALTLDNLVVAVNGATLALVARPTVAVAEIPQVGTAGAYTVLEHSRSSNQFDYANRVDTPTLIPVNASGNLAFTGIAQPMPYAESVPQNAGDIRSHELEEMLFVDSPYAVLEPEADDDAGGGLPPFINPNPVISSVTADETKTVTAVATAGPTDAGDVTSWWEVEIVEGDPQFNFRIDEQDNNFSILKVHGDNFPVPAGINFDEKRIRFVIQSQADPAQIWFSLYVRMEGENFDNSDTEVIILPGAGAPETPPSIELALSLAEQAFVVDEDEAGVQQQLTLSNRSRYKLTRIFVNRRTSPRIEGRNEDGLEFGLLSTLEDFLSLGTQIRTHVVGAGDVGFLDRVAVKFYGPGFEDFWWVIAYANNIADPDDEMFVGQNLVIPPRERLTTFLARKPAPGGV